MKTLFSFSILLSPFLHAAAQYGVLDETFSSDGIAIAVAAGPSYAAAIQPDGKIVVAGADYTINYETLVIRYKTDGTTDNTFGVGGGVHTSWGASILEFGVANAIAVQDDGKIVIAGYYYDGANTDVLVARYTTDGDLDTTFSDDGKLTLPTLGSDVANAVGIQPDGKIVVAGWNTHSFGSENVLVIRFLPDGTPDDSFGDGGIAETDYSEETTDNERIRAMKILPDGKILCAGYTAMPGGEDFALFRFLPDGSLDNTFDGDGVVTTDLGFNTIDYGDDLAVQTDGKIIVSGINSNTYALGVVKYNADGSLDNTFGGGDGMLVNNYGELYGNEAIAVFPDNKIVITSTLYDDDLYSDFFLVQYNPDGTPDNTFGTEGVVQSDFGFFDATSDVQIQDDGKIIIAGATENNNLAVARYTSGFLPLGIQDINTHAELQIFPDPADNTINVNTEISQPSEIEIRIFDMQGNIVQTYTDAEMKSAGSRTISFSLDPKIIPGVYMLQCRSADGYSTTEFVKE